MKTCIRTAIICIIASISIPGYSQENTDTILSRGFSFIETKKYHEAVSEFDKVLKSDKENERAISGKTNAFLLQNKVNDALSFIEDGIYSNPSCPYYFYSRGLVNHYLKQYKKAIDDYSEAMRLIKNENADKMILSRAISYIEYKYYDEAISDLNSYIQKNENNSSALFQRGRAYFLTGNYQMAIDDFNNALKINKNNGYLYYNLGMAYFNNGDQLNACRNFQNACQLNISDACKMVLTECAKKF